jgi:hypothetical protein
MIFNTFRHKKLAFLTHKAKLCKNLIITFVFEKNRLFFAENCDPDYNIGPGTDVGRTQADLQIWIVVLELLAGDDVPQRVQYGHVEFEHERDALARTTVARKNVTI